MKQRGHSRFDRAPGVICCVVELAVPELAARVLEFLARIG